MPVAHPTGKPPTTYYLPPTASCLPPPAHRPLLPSSDPAAIDVTQFWRASTTRTPAPPAAPSVLSADSRERVAAVPRVAFGQRPGRLEQLAVCTAANSQLFAT
jgi:hypothetical protein